MSLISIQLDAKSVEDTRKLLFGIRNGAEKAILRSLNRTADGARTIAVREIGSTVTAPQKRIRENTKVRKANLGQLQASLGLFGPPIPAVDFQHRSTARGTYLKIYKSGSSQLFRHVFKATMPTGHTGLFERALPSVRKSKKAWSKNLPLREKFGPDVSSLFENTTGIRDKVENVSAERLLKELEQQTDYLLKSS